MFIDAKALIEQMGASPIEAEDGQFHLELGPLSLTSIFSKPIDGAALIEILSPEAFCFRSPLPMKALGPLWIEGLDQKSQVISAIQDAIYRLGRRLKLEVQSLTHWGLLDASIDTLELFAQGYYEFQDSRFLYRLSGEQHLTLIAVDDNLIENADYHFNLPKGDERQALEQGAKAHYSQHFHKAPPAIVPILPAFGIGSKPVFDRVANLESILSELKLQIQKVETELNSLKTVIAFTPVPASLKPPSQVLLAKEKTKDSVHTLAHLIAPVSEQVHVNIENTPPEQEFDAPIETVAMDLLNVEFANASDFESADGGIAPTSVSPMLLTPDQEQISLSGISDEHSEDDFEEIRDTVAMDLVGAQNILLGDATQGEAVEPEVHGATKTDEDHFQEEEGKSAQENKVEKQVEDLLAQTPESAMGGFGKSYTGEHVFDSNPLVHTLDPPASIEPVSHDFESEKSTDAALMIEKDKNSGVPGVFDLGGLNEDVLGADAPFTKASAPWTAEDAPEPLGSQSEVSEVTDNSELGFVGQSASEFSEEITSQDIIEDVAESETEVRVALILKHKKALYKLNEKLKTQIPGLVPAMACSELEPYFEREDIRWLVFVRPPKAALLEIKEYKARYESVKIIVVSNDSQTFGDAVEVDHLLPLVNQVSGVAQMIVDILD